MRNYKKYGSRITAVAMATAMVVTSVPSAVSAMAASGTDALADEVETTASEEPVRIAGGVDIEAYNGKVENEYAQPLGGSFSSNAVNLEVPDKDGDEDISVMEWDGTGQWANGKWKVFIQKAGTYTISARMKVTKFDIDLSEDNESGFITCIDPIDDETEDLENNTKQELKVTDGYQTVVLYENLELERGLYGFKMMDGGNHWDGGPYVEAKLDYLQFDCTKQSIPMYQDAVDIDKNGNKLEAEWCTSGSYNVSVDSETVDGKNIEYMEWTKKEWGNGKWQAYFRQAGAYDVVLRMKVTEPAEGDFTNFKFGVYENVDDDPNPDMVIPGKGATEGYEDFIVTGLTIPSTGVWNVKIMDSNQEVSAKLDYIQFVLKEANGPKDDGTEADDEDPTDETPMDSEGTVITEDAVKVWMTSTEKSQDMSWYKEPTEMKNQLAEKAALDITTVDNQEITQINVEPNTTYQTFLGMGSSLEESTVYNLNQLKGEVKQSFIEDLVNPEKGGMTLFRVTIATADFTSQRFYTYYDIDNINEMPADFKPNWYPADGEMGFTIQKDRDYGIIDTIKMVQAAAKKFGVEDEVKFFASSWTPPGWMKNDDAKFASYAMEGEGERLRGGTLNDAHIDDLAMYYLRYLEEYAQEGILIYGMTLQNEPGDEFNYPSCKITGEQEGKLAIKMKELIQGSEILKKNDITDVKLWAFDHNCSIAENYVKAIASVSGAMDAIDGIAFHDYGGDLATMQKILDTYLNQGGKKDQTVNLTERSVWGTKGANSMITYLRNSAISYNAWVTMLDSNVNYHQWSTGGNADGTTQYGTPDPTMFARKADSDTEYWAMPEFYITGQFSRFIRPGYVRVASDEGTTATIRNVVFQNPKTKELVAVVVNASKKKQNFKFVIGDEQFIGAVPAGNVATYVWGAIKTPATPAPVEVSSTKVTLNAKKLYLLKGKSVKIKGVMAPSNTTDKITWSTSKKSVATVKNGKITAKKVGSAIITAKATSGKKANCKVYVVKKQKKSTSIKLNKTKATVKVGAWILLSPTLSPAKSTDTVKWKSSDKKVAFVDAYGFVTGKKKGKAIIMATTSSGKKVKCTITVKQ